MIHIRGKGDKDRYTLLSDKASLLREYLRVSDSAHYVFQGAKPNTP